MACSVIAVSLVVVVITLFMIVLTGVLSELSSSVKVYGATLVILQVELLKSL